MQAFSLLSSSPILLSALAGIIGLMVGSFLNVVIYRLPVMMQQSWRKECLDYLQLPAEPTGDEAFNLAVPPSRCPNCKTPIKGYHNIPVFGYLFLRGQCAACHAPISPRYPLIEALTAVASVVVACHFGYTPQALFALLLTWALIALSFIDIDHYLLPDSITLPFLWLGLLLSLFDLYTDANTAIIGAIGGYMILWTVYHLFKLATGKEGMGYGDFKLLALFGAWLGWHYLPMIILLSSLVGAVIGITMVIVVRHDHRKPIPFGPYLAAAGWIALLWGEDINRFYLTSVGF